MGEFSEIISEIIMLLTTYGYLLLIPLFIIEGPIAGIVAGFLASLGIFNPYVIFAAHIFGDIVADVFVFHSPRYAKRFAYRFTSTRRVMARFQKSDTSDNSTMKRVLTDHFGKLLVFTKTFPMPHLYLGLLITSSLSGISSKRFLTTLFLFQPLWSALLISFGYFFGSGVQNTELFFSGIGVFMAVLLVLVVLYYLYLKEVIRKSFIGNVFRGINPVSEK